MRFFLAATLFAVASAFTTAPNAFSKVRVVDRAEAEESQAPRTRKNTIVMDGKANGEFYVQSVPGDTCLTLKSSDVMGVNLSLVIVGLSLE
jgi:hypothetical protein